MKEKTMLSAAEVAGRLRELAAAMEQGQLTIGQMRAPIAQTMEFEQEYEEKHGKRELKIELEWAA